MIVYDIYLNLYKMLNNFIKFHKNTESYCAFAKLMVRYFYQLQGGMKRGCGTADQIKVRTVDVSVCTGSRWLRPSDYVQRNSA